MNKTRLLVFTDLDGTLLDHDSYSAEPAREALNLLKEHNIPLIFNTSKTRSEVLHLRSKLKNEHPFATENGSSVSIPDNYFDETQHSLSTSHTTMFGSLYFQLRHDLCNLRSEYDFDFTGFGDMSVEKVSSCTGLTFEEAARAQDRDCSEPLLWHDSEEKMELFTRLLLARNLNITRGGRFYHIGSGADKGLAVNWLTDTYRAEYPNTKFMTIGLGDGINDLPMLNAVDYPILIPSKHGSTLTSNALTKSSIRNLSTPDASGPTGWNTAIIKLVQKLR